MSKGGSTGGGRSGGGVRAEGAQEEVAAVATVGAGQVVQEIHQVVVAVMRLRVVARNNS